MKSYGLKGRLFKPICKWFLTKWYKHSPECICGYRMKPTNTRLNEYSWKCLWEKKCGWGTYQTDNGKLHWYR